MESSESLTECFGLVHKRIDFLAILLCVACLTSSILAILVVILIRQNDLPMILSAIEAAKCRCNHNRSAVIGNAVHVETGQAVTVETMAREMLKRQGKID
jgi:hypothetical protein